jgi:hypothetical protein
MYGPMSKLKNKPLTKSLSPFFKNKWSKTTRKHVFHVIFGRFRDIWAPSNGLNEVDKGPQLSRMYGPMSKLKNKSLTKSFGPFFQEKWSKTTRKSFIWFFFLSILRPFVHSQMVPKKYSKASKWATCMAQCLNSEMVHNSQKIRFVYNFGYSGAIWVPPKKP